MTWVLVLVIGSQMAAVQGYPAKDACLKAGDTWIKEIRTPAGFYWDAGFVCIPGPEK